MDELRQEATARRRDQESLQQGEEKYRGIFETIQHVYFETKINGTILELSPSVERLIQYTRQELLGTLVQDRYQAPSEREKIFSEMLAKGRINDLEIAFTDKDGRVMPSAITAMVVAGADGQPAKVYGVLRDISQRKAVELAIRASEERFRQTFEQTAMGMSILSPQGEWLLVNQRLCDILGYTRKELIHLSFRYLTLPEHLVHDEAQMRSMLEGLAQGLIWEKRYLRKDGQVVWARLTSSLVHDDEGQPKYFVTVTEDITERKRAEQKLKQSQAFSSSIIHNSVDCIKVLDMEGYIVFVSPGGLQVLGLTLPQLFPPEDEAGVLRALQTARQGGTGVFQGYSPPPAARPSGGTSSSHPSPRRRDEWRGSWPCRGTSPSSARSSTSGPPWRPNCAKPRRWRPWGPWRGGHRPRLKQHPGGGAGLRRDGP